MSDLFTMTNYASRPTFSSFLPGIAGPEGIPVWCYYNNRGQCVCSFGIRDKDHAIMEFSPAHVAYRDVARTGFRTFLKTGDHVVEAFSDPSGTMEIAPNRLTIRWSGEDFRVQVTYTVLPSLRVGALAREVEITNLGAKREVTVLDGMPQLVPYGVGQDSLKNMTQLSKAWMQVEDIGTGLAYYRVRASMADTAVVTAIAGGNFALGLTETGEHLKVIADPEVVFGYDTSLEKPLGFTAADFSARAEKQITQNLFPCAFFSQTRVMDTGERLILREIYGQAENKDVYHAFAAERMDESWFARKVTEAEKLTEQLTQAADTKTADPAFDAYCRQTYLDNVLRGGEPIRFAWGEHANVFWLYSRKHGDPEREYNYFVMSPEYYSQGNGNFRDVCQNRREDVRFHPFVGDTNIRLFFSLLQSDGYNPLVIDRMTFTLEEAARRNVLSLVEEGEREAAEKLLASPFTPGALAMAAERWHFAKETTPEDFTCRVLAESHAEPNAVFQEGYWSDHWTYSLDLIENYLSIYPDREEALLMGARDLPWFESQCVVLPLEKRVIDTPTGKRQGRFLDMERKAESPRKWMQEKARGTRAESTLLEKLVFLCAVKYATLDRTGTAVEMEGGKPGWYDALNGLPGLFGASVAEGCELRRLLGFTAKALRKAEGAGKDIQMYREMGQLMERLSSLPSSPEERWAKAQDILEEYREATAEGVDGERIVYTAGSVAAILEGFAANMDTALKATVQSRGICPTYIMYPEGVPEVLPDFLEGPVRWMKLEADPEEKREMHRRIISSDLYDRKLQMFKVNASLEKLTYEAGRTRAFTPGWLENESIWQHMEYKYLLELLRSGLYREFIDSADTALVPYMDPEVYGRSIYENVSFIASSANPNPAFHGRGFVARLTGSTIEFLSMWQLMFFGKTPFTLDADTGALTLQFAPMLPARLIPENGQVSAMFLSSTRVTYVIPGAGDLIPGTYQTEKIEMDGKTYGSVLSGADALLVREGKAKHITVYLKRT